MATVVLTEAAIREATDSQSFTRGQAYFASGHVRKLAIEGPKVTARVDGTATYRVKLALTTSGLTGQCSCPYGAFCKHCVATAFAWLRKGGKPTASPPKPVVDLQKFLLAQKRSWLTDQLMQAASTDPLLLARLEVAAGADARSAYDSSALRERLERAMDVPTYVDYHESGTYFENVDDAIDEVASVAQSFPDVAIDVAEYALELLEDAVERIEDIEGVDSAIGRLEEIHFAACSAGSPDPVELASRLASRALDGQCDVFTTVLPDYAPIFGPEGLARYRELVEQGSGHMAKHLLELVADAEGGSAAVIDILARRVESAVDILRIAELHHQDRRDAKALEWLSRGLSEYPRDRALRSLAAKLHLAAGRSAEACELLWENFAVRPFFVEYRALQEAAGESFTPWRKRALKLLRTQPTRSGWFERFPGPDGHTALVQVLLQEQDVVGAWEAATSGGCRDNVWLEVARARASTHPAEAIPVLLAAAEAAIERKNRDSYREATSHLTETRALFKRCGQVDDFKTHMAELRTTHKSKRVLREELDRAGLP